MKAINSDVSTDDRRVEIVVEGRLVAGADIHTSTDLHGTARVAFFSEAGHLAAGTRQGLVDTVLDLPDVHASSHLDASVPLGDVETMSRLRQRTLDMHTHAAGSTVLIEAELSEEQVRLRDV